MFPWYRTCSPIHRCFFPECSSKTFQSPRHSCASHTPGRRTFSWNSLVQSPDHLKYNHATLAINQLTDHLKFNHATLAINQLTDHLKYFQACNLSNQSVYSDNLKYNHAILAINQLTDNLKYNHTTLEIYQ